MKGGTPAECAAKRRFAILAILHRRSRSYDEILAMLEQQQLLDEDRSARTATIARQLRYQFRHDLAALRLMGCHIVFERSGKCYAWRNSPFGLTLGKAQLTT